MPVKKGKGCVADVMREWKAGQLHSGEDGKVVKDQKQAVAIALSMCGGSREKAKSYEEYANSLVDEVKDTYAEKCGCKHKKGTKEYGECNCGCKGCKRRAMAIGYPTPTFGEEETIGMIRTRLKVMHGRLSDIERAIEMAMMRGSEIEMEPWMIDKITLAADYLSAVADNAVYGDGIEVEMENEGEEEEGGYAQFRRFGYAEGKG
jgi:hypothetical protein